MNLLFSVALDLCQTESDVVGLIQLAERERDDYRLFIERCQYRRAKFVARELPLVES